jgi:S-adenosylmethionine-diacylgycerolhomoserine-N-methlytransferase
MSQVQAMDRMYRYQRYIYDLTRKYYLFGRDKLIKQITIEPNEQILEMGCGTGRNLLLLAKRYPNASYYGIDASQEMLNTAQAKLKTKNTQNFPIIFQQCLAEELDYQKTFGLTKPFDKIFYSYSLSMIPPWREALEAGLNNLKPNGTLYIVDFSDQRNYPAWFRKILKRWLDLFGVHYKPELLDYLQYLQAQGKGYLQLEGIGGHYAFLATFKKA